MFWGAKIMGNKVIIFGASGFVGKAIKPLFDQNGILTVASSSAALNLTLPSSVQAVSDMVSDGDTVIFLSAYTPEKGDVGALTIKNLLMIQHVLAGIQTRFVAQFIYISSDAVYPMTSDIIDEQTAPRPYDLYGHMHLMREHYAQRKIAPEKLTILRPCAIYGKDDTHNSYSINRFIRAALSQGEITLFGEGEEYRDHIYIDDFAALVVHVYKQRAAGILNVATGVSWRFSEIAMYIQKQVKSEVKITRRPRALAITHRHFNTSKLFDAFPNHHQRNIDRGIESFLSSLAP